MEETILNDAYEVCKIVNNMPRQQLCQCQDVISAYVGRLKELPDSLVREVITILKSNRNEENTEAYIYLTSIIINITLEAEELVTLEEYIMQNKKLDAGKNTFYFIK